MNADGLTHLTVPLLKYLALGLNHDCIFQHYVGDQFNKFSNYKYIMNSFQELYQHRRVRVNSFDNLKEDKNSFALNNFFSQISLSTEQTSTNVFMLRSASPPTVSCIAFCVR